MKVIDQTKIYQSHKGEWVILDSSRHQVLASDEKLSRAVAKFRQKYGKRKVPLTFKVPSKIMPYIGC